MMKKRSRNVLLLLLSFIAMMMMMTSASRISENKEEDGNATSTISKGRVFVSRFDGKGGETHITKATSALCEESETLARTFLKFDEECDESLKNVKFHYTYYQYLYRKHHFAEVVARNGLATAVAKRGVSMGENAAGLGVEANRGSRFVEFERAMHSASMRLVNAQGAAKQTFTRKAFREDERKRVVDLGRTCADACRQTIDHARALLSVLSSEVRTNLETRYDRAEVEALAGPNPENVTCAKEHEHTMSTQLRGLIEHAQKKESEWMRAVDIVDAVWKDIRATDAMDGDANKAMMEWSTKSDGSDVATVTTWLEEIERAIAAQNNVTKQVEYSQHRMRLSLPQNRLVGDDSNEPHTRQLETFTSASERAALKAQEDVSISTVAILSAYRKFASVSREMYTAAMRGTADAAIKATRKQREAINAVDAAVDEANRAVEEAASVSGRWESPENSMATMSVSTAGSSATAPRNAFGDFALALQRTQGIAEEEAVAAREGDPAARERAEASLVIAQDVLKKKIKAMNKARAPREDPSRSDIEETAKARNDAVEASMKMRREIDEREADIPPARPAGKTPSEPLSESERLATIQQDVETLAKYQRLEPLKQKFFNHAATVMNEAEDSHSISKQRYEENRAPK